MASADRRSARRSPCYLIEYLELARHAARERTGPAGVPPGLLADIDYDRAVVRPQPRDLVTASLKPPTRLVMNSSVTG
ncbi:MAG: hypothetical protein H0U13_16525 [Gemmatimonadaceae bacterium]|nr:hypothetical protein [Gemmatimonadaceae bacterium]